MPHEDPQLRHYRRDSVPGSRVPGIGYPTTGQHVYGFPPQMPSSFPHQGGVAPLPPGLTPQGFPMPRAQSTTIVIPPGGLKGKNVDKLQDMLGPTLSPIIKALMGKKDKD